MRFSASKLVAFHIFRRIHIHQFITDNNFAEETKKNASKIKAKHSYWSREYEYHLGAVFDRLLGVEGAILSGDPLANDAGVLIHENGGRGRWRSKIALLLLLQLGPKRPRREIADQSLGGLAGHGGSCLCR